MATVAGYRLIPLSGARGICALARVDEADYGSLSRYRWRLDPEGYAVKGRYNVAVHRVLLGLDRGDRRRGDHIGFNRLDNRRANLRVVTGSGNAQNQRLRCDNTSGYRGVSRVVKSGRWKADVTIDGRRHALGCYPTPEEASVVASRFRAEHMPFSPDARA